MTTGDLKVASVKTDTIKNQAGTAAMTINSTGAVQPTASGSVVAVRHYSNNTRVASVSTAATGTLWSFTDTKLYGSESTIIIHANLIGWDDASGVIGMYIEYASTKSYSIQFTYDENAYCKMLTGTSSTTGKSAGSQTVNIGWDAANGTSSRPFVTLNPNSTDDARMHQTVSTAIVYEVIA